MDMEGAGAGAGAGASSRRRRFVPSSERRAAGAPAALQGRAVQGRRADAVPPGRRRAEAGLSSRRDRRLAAAPFSARAPRAARGRRRRGAAASGSTRRRGGAASGSSRRRRRRRALASSSRRRRELVSSARRRFFVVASTSADTTRGVFGCRPRGVFAPRAALRWSATSAASRAASTHKRAGSRGRRAAPALPLRGLLRARRPRLLYRGTRPGAPASGPCAARPPSPAPRRPRGGRRSLFLAPRSLFLNAARPRATATRRARRGAARPRARGSRRVHWPPRARPPWAAPRGRPRLASCGLFRARRRSFQRRSSAWRSARAPSNMSSTPMLCVCRRARGAWRKMHACSGRGKRGAAAISFAAVLRGCGGVLVLVTSLQARAYARRGLRTWSLLNRSSG